MDSWTENRVRSKSYRTEHRQTQRRLSIIKLFGGVYSELPRQRTIEWWWNESCGKQGVAKHRAKLLVLVTTLRMTRYHYYSESLGCASHGAMLAQDDYQVRKLKNYNRLKYLCCEFHASTEYGRIMES